MSNIQPSSSSDPCAGTSTRCIMDAFDVSAIIAKLAAQGTTIDQDQLGAACATQLAHVTAAIEDRTSMQVELDTTSVASLHSGTSQSLQHSHPQPSTSSHHGSNSGFIGKNMTIQTRKGQAHSPSAKYLSSLQRLESGLEWHAKACSIQEITLA